MKLPWELRRYHARCEHDFRGHLAERRTTLKHHKRYKSEANIQQYSGVCNVPATSVYRAIRRDKLVDGAKSLL